METENLTNETPKAGSVNASSLPAGAAAAATKPGEPSKRPPRRDERQRKDDRSFDMYTKAINSAPQSEQLALASQKFLAMLEENKKMQFYIKQSEKRYNITVKEKDQLQTEFNKTILLKSKLENLCRELQKQNKAIKEESLHKIREEEERRKETQVKFQTTLAEISTLLQQNNEKNVKLRDDNISMTEKFKSVVQQYQLREDQVEKMSKQMELESQLNAAKLQKAKLEHQAERERLLVEMEHLKAAVAEYRGKVNDMTTTETGLRNQLGVYTDKYDEFQSALMKSNQVFGGFKEQMEKMSKKIKKLEKESLSWKQRWESSQSALLDMCGERQASDVRLVAIQRQLAHMQSLCRTLQAERTVLLATLKEHDIERPPLPTPAPVSAPDPLPAPPTASDAKVDAMAANCAQLRQSLAHLQSQLNVLTTQQTEEAQVEKPKKNKNKKNKTKKAVDEPKNNEATDDKTESPEDFTKEPTDSLDTDLTESDTVKDDKDLVSQVDESGLELLMEAINKEIAVTTRTVSGDSGVNPVTETEPKESVDLAVDNVDEKVLESLMNVLNKANVNLSDLKVVDNTVTDDTLDTTVEDTTEPGTTENEEKTDNTVAESPKKESPVKSPKNKSPKKTKDSPKKLAFETNENTQTEKQEVAENMDMEGKD